MKTLNYILVLVLLAATFTSCKKEITGSGHFVNQSRVVAPFTEVVSSGDYNVILKEDPSSRVELYGEDNILPEIETEVSGNKLKIYYNHHHYNYDHSGITITVYTPAFRNIDLQGSGNITSYNVLHTNTMKVNLSGSGKIDLAVFSPYLSSTISGSGKIYLNGIVPQATHTISGSGKIKAFGLQSDFVTAKISGSGNCEVSVTDQLFATISGSGSIIYRGNPDVIKNISGSGSVGRD